MHALEALKIAKESRKNKRVQSSIEDETIAQEMKTKAEELMQHYILNRILAAANDGKKYTIITCKDMFDKDDGDVYWKERYALVESLKAVLKHMGYKVKTYDPYGDGDICGMVVKWGMCIVLD